jgi:site-specific recombinase XerD
MSDYELPSELASTNESIVQKRFRTYAKRAKEIMNEARAENTKKAYQNDWRDFTNWCQNHQLVQLPANSETLMYYLIGMADGGMKLNTIQRRMASISVAHLTAGFPSPTKDPKVLLTWDGLRRTVGWNETAKSPFLVNDLREIVKQMDIHTLIGLRDRALLLHGFMSAFRRSELVEVNLEDIRWSSEGMVIRLRKSKTNQEGKEETKVIPYGKHSGDLFCSRCASVDRCGWIDKWRSVSWN